MPGVDLHHTNTSRIIDGRVLKPLDGPVLPGSEHQGLHIHWIWCPGVDRSQFRNWSTEVQHIRPVLDELATEGVYESAFVFAPLPLKGATGSPGNPIAVK